MVLPCSLAFAFALGLIRTKPVGISIEDFILILRKSSSRVQDTSEPFVIDRGKVWEQLILLIQQTSRCLPDQKSRLPGEHNGNDEFDLDAQIYGGTKRKLRGEETALTDFIPRPKRRESPSLLGKAIDSYATNDGAQCQGRVQTAPESNMDESSLPQTLSKSCEAILRLDKAVQSTKDAGRRGEAQGSELDEAFQTMMQIWSVIVSTLGHRHKSSGADLNVESVTSQMSSAVDFLLSYLRQHCLREAERRQTGSLIICGQTDAETHTGLQKDTILRGDLAQTSDIITGALKNIVLTLKALQKKHGELVNTITSKLLHHIGETMTIHLLKPYKQYPAQQESTLHTKPLCAGVQDMISAVEIEAPFLIEILSSLVQVLGLKTSACSRSEVLENFQKSLLRSTFEDEDETVSTEAQISKGISCGAVKNANLEAIHNNDEDWFLTQVWALLGWDIWLES